MFHFWWEKYKARHLSKRAPGGSSLVWVCLFLHLSCTGAGIAADNAREQLCLRPQIQSLRNLWGHHSRREYWSIWLGNCGTCERCLHLRERKWPKHLTLIHPPLIRRIIPPSCDSGAGSVCQSYDRPFICASDKCIALSWWNRLSRHSMLHGSWFFFFSIWFQITSWFKDTRM